MALSYQTPGLVLRRGSGTRAQVRDLQQHLRRLGYLEAWIDGDFGGATERAVMALQYDLLKNRGEGDDGRAPVRVRDYNQSRVSAISGEVDQKLAKAIAEMLADERFTMIPSSADPAGENAKLAAAALETASLQVAGPFLTGVLMQESGMRHFREPAAGNDDNFVYIGLDRNARGEPAITSRGYGAGQYTLFHHPPAKAEAEDFILDPAGNVRKAARELKEKFERFVNGQTPGTRADDRQAEYGSGPLRLCRYAPGDPRFLTDCRRCLRDAGAMDIRAGTTRFYEGARQVYETTQYYREAVYEGVPVRKNIPCDWPYAVRRYNGGGVNSYHYQTKVLLHVVRG